MNSLKHQYTFEYAPDIQCATVTWHGHSTEKQLHEINRLFLEYIKEHKASKIINDVLIMSEVSDTYKKWLAEEYIPLLYKEGIRYAAVIYPIRQVDVSNLNSLVEEVNDKSIITRCFILINYAKEWLKTV